MLLHRVITDFLPLFVWVLVQCGFHRAEIEAEYTWGLAHPSLFNGEGGYYLTTLTSAVNVLKALTQPPAQPMPHPQVRPHLLANTSIYPYMYAQSIPLSGESH